MQKAIMMLTTFVCICVWGFAFYLFFQSNSSPSSRTQTPILRPDPLKIERTELPNSLKEQGKLHDEAILKLEESGLTKEDIEKIIDGEHISIDELLELLPTDK